MAIKYKIREALNKYLGKYGYSLVKTQKDISQLKIIIDDTLVAFDQKGFKKRDAKVISLNWIIPPMGAGSGGHLNIFRTIHLLRQQGIDSKIFIYGGNEKMTPEELHDIAVKFYGDIIDSPIYASYKMMNYADGVVATSWQTAYTIKHFNNCVSKFYFVQDYEPYFYGMGSEYAFAENTYRLGYRGITAGFWLADKLKEEFGMETQGFGFSYDRDIYHLEKKQDPVNRVFFYARPYTDRRAFEVGVLALELLKRRIPDLEVVCAGQKLPMNSFSFPYKDAGILKLEELSHAYSQCDLCLVLSMTNLSLLPMEIMASGSVCVSNRGANNEWGLNESNAILVDVEPYDIAEKMEYYLKNKIELEPIRKNGLDYAESITWASEVSKVSRFVKESVNEDIIEYERSTMGE